MWKMDEAIKQSGKYTDQEVSALEALFSDSRIVEQGSNANGEYWRWESGLQICVRKNRLDLVYANNSSYLNQLWTFPAGFGTLPVVVATPTNEAGYGLFAGMGTLAIHDASTDSVRIFAWRTSAQGDIISVKAIAIGRWKA